MTEVHTRQALTLSCQDEQRRHQVRKKDFNGLDYLEVSDDQRTLTIYFLAKAPSQISIANVRIDGGRRITGIKVVGIRLCIEDDPDLDDCMMVTVDRPGDASTYTLCLVKADDHGRPGREPLDGFDPRYTCLKFSFKANCPSDLDCRPEEICPPEPLAEPEINYLAKDYASFRQLMLDRLALIMPGWTERHVPDGYLALVEVLAYVGDHLSYYQDAVATEAYLETARQRISVRRHARLVDYHMHEGCNARAWVCLETDSDLSLDPDDIYFITGRDLPAGGAALTPDDLRNISPGHYETFEPLIENPEEPIWLYAAHNEIHFYTWGDQECCLPRGATSATLLDAQDEIVIQQEADESETYEQRAPEQASEKAIYPTPEPERKLHLQPGDSLIFEEKVGPKTGVPADADPTHRHAVRLTRVTPDVDPLYNQPIVEIEWAEEDALPFPLCISAIGPAPACELLENISVACGNVILVDYGRRVEAEPLGSVPVEATEEWCGDDCHPAETILMSGKFRPRLQWGPLSFSQPLPSAAPASSLLTQDPRRALPQIELTATQAGPDGDIINAWTPQPDLLSSRADDRHFVVEIDNEGRAHLRFGDGELGRRPEAGTAFTATYWLGNGPAGNVGAKAISHIVLRQTRLSGVTLQPRNPLPAQGGTLPEPLVEVKLFAPHAFRGELQRAITADDYARLAERHPKVQRAAAALRWTGSWYEVLVAIDPLGQGEADEALLREIHGYLYRYRRMGHDVVVAPAHYVSLDIEMTVCVLPHYLRGHVKAALLNLFSNRTLPDGRRGFFHPDNLTFGEGIYLSQLVALAQAVSGVESVIVTRLERFFEGPNGEIENGLLPLGPLEVARLDNDPSFPENGRLKLTMRGGR